MFHTVTCEARHLPRDGVKYLTHVEGVKLHLTDPDRPGLLVEAVQVHTEDPNHPDWTVINLSVWHDRGWMFGISLQPDDVVTWQYEGPDDEFLNIPKPPDRTDQVRVHGTWYARGEVEWAPNGHPFRM